VVFSGSVHVRFLTFEAHAGLQLDRFAQIWAIFGSDSNPVRNSNDKYSNPVLFWARRAGPFKRDCARAVTP